MKKFILIFIALLLNTSAFTQFEIEKGLPINVESKEVDFKGLEKFEEFQFSEVIKFSENYFLVRKSPKEGRFVVSKFNEELEQVKSVDLSEVLNVNGHEIIKTKSLGDRLIIVTISVNKKEKTQTCNAHTLTYENMSLNQKVELKTQYYKKQKMKVEIITSHNNNILFKISEAENKEHYSYISHYILTDNNLESISDYSNLINKNVTGLLKKGIFVLTPDVVLSTSNEVIMAGITRNPVNSYFSGIVFKYTDSKVESYDFEDKLPMGLSDNLIVKLDANGVLYAADYTGDKKENLIFFSFNTVAMEPIVMCSKTSEENIRMKVSNIIPLANQEVMIIGKKIYTTRLDNVHSASYSIDEMEISIIDENGTLTFQKSIEVDSPTDKLLLNNPISCIVKGTEVTLVYNNTQYQESEKALVGSVINENEEIDSYKIIGYVNKPSNYNFVELYQVGKTTPENKELIGLIWSEDSKFELVLISSEE